MQTTNEKIQSALTEHGIDPVEVLGRIVAGAGDEAAEIRETAAKIQRLVWTLLANTRPVYGFEEGVLEAFQELVAAVDMVEVHARWHENLVPAATNFVLWDREDDDNA